MEWLCFGFSLTEKCDCLQAIPVQVTTLIIWIEKAGILLLCHYVATYALWLAHMLFNRCAVKNPKHFVYDSSPSAENSPFTFC